MIRGMIQGGPQPVGLNEVAEKNFEAFCLIQNWRKIPGGDVVSCGVICYKSISAIGNSYDFDSYSVRFHRGALEPQNNDFTDPVNNQFKDGLEELLVSLPEVMYMGGTIPNQFYGFEFTPRV